MNNFSVRITLARNIKRARKRLRLSQMALAERCKVSTSYIGEIEIGRKYPSSNTLEKLADSLSMRPYQLFLEEENWEVHDRLDAVVQMHRELKERLIAVLDDALLRHSS